MTEKTVDAFILAFVLFYSVSCAASMIRLA